MTKAFQDKGAQWRKYKADFLRANRCTVERFERDYRAFIARKPGDKDYEAFARKYQIVIHFNPFLPKHLRVRLCVSVAAIKVLAKDHIEAEKAVAELTNRTEGKRGDKLQ